MKFSTGDIPTEGLLSNKSVNNIADLGYSLNFFLWSQNLDAPDYIPAGSTKNVTHRDGDISQGSRYASR